MAAANFLWLHFLNNRSSIQFFFFEISESHPLNGQREQTTLLERDLFFPFEWRRIEPIAIPWKCHSEHIMEL